MPTILHDGVLLLKIPYHFILVRLDDVMQMGTELGLMGYALIASEARKNMQGFQVSHQPEEVSISFSVSFFSFNF